MRLWETLFLSDQTFSKKKKNLKIHVCRYYELLLNIFSSKISIQTLKQQEELWRKAGKIIVVGVCVL